MWQILHQFRMTDVGRCSVVRVVTAYDRLECLSENVKKRSSIVSNRLMIILILLIWAGPNPARASAFFPPDSGIIDVRHFGAVGDGIADDTEAILRAIAEVPPSDKKHPLQTRIVYFPSGTYRVSNTILRRTSDGRFEPNMVLIGESRANTTIRLSDSASGYNDPAHPKAVIYTSSGLNFMKDPHDGGRDYLHKGEGNEAFGNTVENLTVDVGRGNSGAIGIDFLANNEGVVRNVTIRAATKAYAGLSMIRRWPGPALISNVSIVGFDIGIDIAWTELSMTFSKIQIEGSKEYGIRNESNVISFHDLQIVTQSGYGLANMSSNGLIVGIDGRISGRGVGPLLNNGTINFKNVLAQEFHTTAGETVNARLDGVFQSKRKISNSGWKLPILSPPEPAPAEIGEWTNIKKFGAVADPKVNSTGAFISAFNSDARVIYIPTGQYFVDRPIPIADNIERIEGMFSIINTGWGYHAPDSKIPYSLFRTSPSRKKTLFIRRLTLEKSGDVFAVIDHHSGATLVMSDISGFALINRPAEGGPIFADNTAAGYVRVSGSAGVWFRQFNTEGGRERIINNGSPLWILGTKTEQTNTLVQNINGANTEIAGALIYRVYGTAPQMPLFVNVDGHLVASYAEEAFRPDAFYSIHLDSRVNGEHRVVRAEEFPKRGPIARMVPSLSTDVSPH